MTCDAICKDIELLKSVVYIVDARARIGHCYCIRIRPRTMAKQRINRLDVVLGVVFDCCD